MGLSIIGISRHKLNIPSWVIWDISCFLIFAENNMNNFQCYFINAGFAEIPCSACILDSNLFCLKQILIRNFSFDSLYDSCPFAGR